MGWQGWYDGNSGKERKAGMHRVGRKIVGYYAFSPHVVWVPLVIVWVCLESSGQETRRGNLGDNSALQPDKAIALEIMEVVQPLRDSVPPPEEFRKDLKRRTEYAKKGEAIFPGVLYIVQNEHEPIIIANVLHFVASMHVDNTPLLPYVRALLSEAEPIRRSAGIEGLGVIGTKEDIPTLLTILQDERESWQIKYAAAGAIAKLGDPDVLLLLKDAIEKRKASIPAEKWNRDTFLVESARAVSALEEKVRKPPTSVDGPVRQEDGAIVNSSYFRFALLGVLGLMLIAGCAWAFLRKKRAL
jgi:hypothetical protein